MTFVIAHRGAEPEYENTIRSVRKALRNGIKWIELDVRVTKDSIPIIIHDDRVDRTTTGKGYVNQKTLAQIKNLRIKKDGGIPTLQEVFDLTKGRCKLLLELKTPDALRPALKLIRKNKMKDSIVMMSFAHVLVKYSKKLLKTKTAIPIVELPIKPQRLLKETKADILMIYYETLIAANSISKKLIKKLHKRKKKVFVFPVDESTVFTKEQVKMFAEFGVDGIISNNPIKIKKILEAGI